MSGTDTDTEVSARTYAEVQLFHARQMRMMDELDFDGFAATFIEDGEFSHTPGQLARTREGIVAELQAFHRRFADDPVIRRHWFGMLELQPAGDGALRASYYAYTVQVRPGGDQRIGPSCVVTDVLVREDGELRNRSRVVRQDRLRLDDITS